VEALQALERSTGLTRTKIIETVLLNMRCDLLATPSAKRRKRSKSDSQLNIPDLFD
jgi:hypothetical protein